MRRVRGASAANFLPGFGKVGMREFGGSALKGNAREARPISIKRPIHLVMRSSLAVRDRSFLKPQRARMIEKLVHRLGKECGVKVYRFANSGNHLHFVILPTSRRAFNRYVRSVSGIIARMSLGIERGNGLKSVEYERGKELPRLRIESGKKLPTDTNIGNALRAPSAGESIARFWDSRPYTRIIEWGREFKSVCSYVMQNTLEALGFIAYQPRKKPPPPTRI